MRKTACVALGVSLAAGHGTSASPPPQAEISSGPIHLRLYLPDVSVGFYRGTRFDWSGVISSLQYAGHEYYPQWFQRSDPGVHDFIYDGDDIVAGPCTAITGPAEEFVSKAGGLGFDNAKAGETFVKIGVGILRRPDERPYDPFRLYPIADAGKWTVTSRVDSVDFRQELGGPAAPYAYDYRKTVSVMGDKRLVVLDHCLRNVGTQPIEASVYNHNFLYLDRKPPGPGISLAFPFQLSTSAPLANDLAEVRGNRITFARGLTGQDRAQFGILGFGSDPKDYDIRIEDRRVGAGVRVTADRPLSRLVLWAIRAPLSIEPFIDMKIAPGEQFTWRITYEYFTASDR